MAELRERIAKALKRNCVCAFGAPDAPPCVHCFEDADAAIKEAAKWLRDWSGRIVDGGNGASAVVARLADELEGR